MFFKSDIKNKVVKIIFQLALHPENEIPGELIEVLPQIFIKYVLFTF